MAQEQSFFDKCFKDKDGRWAIALWPNPSLIIWAIAALASRIIKRGLFHTAFSVAAFIAITIWALLEIFQGTNYFRRALGAVVLVAVIYSLLH